MFRTDNLCYLLFEERLILGRLQGSIFMDKTHLYVNLQNVTVNISQLIESTLPEEYAERKQIHEEEMKKLAR